MVLRGRKTLVSVFPDVRGSPERTFEGRKGMGVGGW